jgi:hypothetical protein
MFVVCSLADDLLVNLEADQILSPSFLFACSSRRRALENQFQVDKVPLSFAAD